MTVLLWQKRKWNVLFRSVVWLILVTFSIEVLGIQPAAWAQAYTRSLPVPGTKVLLSPPYDPILMQGVKVYVDNPFRFDFFIDTDKEGMEAEEIQKESSKLVKYFLAALTVPEEDQWVNLSPYEKDRITPSAFGVTEMGRDLLAQDYLLKQLSASLMDPTTIQGGKFWQKVYADHMDLIGGTDGAVNTFHKVWIVPESAEVYTTGDSAFVTESHLKVMLEEDYLAVGQPAASNNPSPRGDYASVVRQEIVPAIEKEVNEGKNFVLLRQIYNAMILATWFKRHLRANVFGKVYVGQNKVAGIDVEDKEIKEKIYQQYLEAFKKGVINFIHEDYDPVTQEIIPRKYFSGGIAFTHFGNLDKGVYRETRDPAALSKLSLRPSEFLGRLFYKVSSVVVNPGGVEWYNKMDIARPEVRAEGAWKPSGIIAKRKSFRTLMALLFLASSLTFSLEARGAEFGFDTQQRMTVKVQQGDTAGHIVKILKDKQRQADVQGYRHPLSLKLWGAGGAVEVIAQSMGIKNVELIYPGDTFIIPAGLLSARAQGAFWTGEDVGQSASAQDAPLLMAGHVDNDASAAAEIFTPSGTKLSIPETPVLPMTPAVAGPDYMSTFRPLTVTALLLTALGFLGRQYLSRRTTASITVDDHPRPSGFREEEAGVPTVDNKTNAAVLLARHIRSVSLPYLETDFKVRERINMMGVLLADDLSRVFDQTGLWSKEKTSAAVKELAGKVTSAMKLAWENLYDRPAVEALIDVNAQKMAGLWALTESGDFEDEVLWEDFIDHELNVVIEKKFQAASARLDRIVEEESKAVYNAHMTAAVRWAVAQGEDDLSQSVAAISEGILEDMSVLWGGAITPSGVPDGFVFRDEDITPENLVAVIRRESPVSRISQGRLRQKSRELTAGLSAVLVDSLTRRLSVSRASAEETVGRDFEPRVARYWYAGLYQRYMAATVEEAVKDKAVELVSRYRAGAIALAEISTEILNFVRGPLSDVVEENIVMADESLRREFLNKDMVGLYETAIHASVEMEKAVANGSAPSVDKAVRRAGDTVARILQEDHQLFVLPLWAMAAAEDLEAVLPDSPRREPLGDNGSSMIKDRSPPQNFAVVDTAVLLTTAAAMVGAGHQDIEGLLWTLSAPFVFRGGMTASYWLHEFSHILAGGPRAFKSANLRANVGVKDWLAMLVPFVGMVPSDLKVRVEGGQNFSPWVNRLIALGTSTALMVAAAGALGGMWHAGMRAEVFLSLPLMLGSAAVWVGALKTDLILPLRGRAKDDEFCCGVAIAVNRRQKNDSDILGLPARQTFESLGAVTDIRGQQAAGVKTIAYEKNGNGVWVGYRMVNAKRGALPPSLDKGFSKELSRARAQGLKGPEDYSVIIGHYRYGTSSAPKVMETHPHQWMPDRAVKVWSLENGQLLEKERKLGIVIVHNGDFDGWHIYGTEQSNSDIGLWLERVLHTKNDTQGDSPKVAGMMDFLRTAGMWDASARLAYYFEIARSLGEVFGSQPPSKTAPNTALTAEEIELLASRFREVFIRQGQAVVGVSDTSLADIGRGAALSEERKQQLLSLEDAMVDNLAGLDIVQSWDQGQRRRFVHRALEAFLLNDEYHAVQVFFENAVGAFGLGVGSTLKTDGVIVAADGQPLAIGWDASRQNIIVVSEPSALKVPLGNGQALDYRFSLKQTPGQGEIVNISGDRLTVYSRQLNRELTEEEVGRRRVPLRDNPYITPLPDMAQDDPVGADIKDTAKVMADIRSHWEDAGSFNRQTERNILRLLLQKQIANDIRRLAAPYITVDSSLYGEARKMSSAFGAELVTALEDEVDPGRDWVNDLQMQKALAGFVRLLEGGLHTVFHRKRVEQLIHEEAVRIAEGMFAGNIDEDDVPAKIHDFVKTRLGPTIEAERSWAVGQMNNVMVNWKGVVKSQLLLEVRRALLVKDPRRIAQAGGRTFHRMEEKWRQMGLEPGPALKKLSVDVLVTGIETSIWVGEQFVLDLKSVFPDLNVKSLSANGVLKDPSALGVDEDTVILAISQSGQTFPSLNSVLALEGLVPGRVFVLTGEWDTLAGAAVGQEFAPDSPFSGRIISNLTGFRPSEAVSLTGTATHATLTELLLRLGEDFRTLYPRGKPFGMTLARPAIEKLKGRRDIAVTEMEHITGVTVAGQKTDAPENKALTAQAKRWAQHVLDEPVSRVVTTIHLVAAVVGGFLLFPFLAELLPFAVAASVVAVAQYFFFEFFKYSTVLTRRAIQGRELFARTGKRAVVIGDTSYVHQVLEIFVSKMNALSKSATAVDVHGANPNDHMLHRFGHRVVRGTLVWLGVPDGRLGSKLADLQSAVLMTGKQAKGVRNFGIGAEVVTVGRPRKFNPNAADVDITINGETPDIGGDQGLALLYENRFDSLSRLVAGQVFFHSMQWRVATLNLPPGWRKLWPWTWKINRTQSGPRIATTAAPVSVAGLSGGKTQGASATLPLGLMVRSLPASGIEEEAGIQKHEGPSASSPVVPDGTTVEDVGGINLNPSEMDIRFKGQERPLPLNMDLLIDPQFLNTMPQDRFIPFIIEVVPISNVDMFLGMSQEEGNFTTAVRQ